ncbi:MAG: hypothetical protein AAB883_01210, partial [Patescibacteria group bacterium]
MSVLLFLVVVAVLVAAVFAVLGLIRGYRTWRKNQRLREEVLGSLSSTGGVSMRLRAALKHCTLPILPIWAEESERSHREAFDHVLDEEASTRVKVRSLLRRNPSEAAKLMEVVKQRLIEAQELLVYFQSTPERIKAFRTETYAKVREATSLADALLTRAKKLEQDGYGKMVAAFASQIATVKSDMEKLRTACAECCEGAKDTSHLVQQKAAKVVESVNACSTPLELLLHKQQSTAERIRRIRQRMKEFPARLTEHGARLTMFKSSAPGELWSPFTTSLRNLSTTLAMVEPLVASSESGNSMQEQDFLHAESVIDRADKALATAEAEMSKLTKIVGDYSEAQVQYPRLRASAESALNAARRAVADNDVGPAAKSSVSGARTQFDSVTSQLADSRLPNWIAVCAVLS